MARRCWGSAVLAVAAGTALTWVGPPRPSVPSRVRLWARGGEEGAEETEIFKVEFRPNERLDTFLGDKYDQSRNYFANLIERGAVLVNGESRKRSWNKLRRGDVVEVRFLIDHTSLDVEPEDIPLDILHEDEDILVLNKQPGLVVHPAPGHWTGTLVNGVMYHLGASSSSELPGDAPLRPGLVHRLDAGTSGVIVVTKNTDAYTKLNRAFAEREVSKTYLAVVAGNRKAYRGFPKGRGFVIEHPLGRSTSDRTKMGVLPEKAGGRSAKTVVRSLAEGVDPDVSFLEVKPRTGRTHQIRVHLATEHTPVLGDDRYGFHYINRRSRVANRPLLHAFRIDFDHPRTGERSYFEAPIPQDILKALGWMEPQKGLEDEVVELLGSEPRPRTRPRKEWAAP